MRNLLWTNDNPIERNICAMCAPFIGQVFADGDQLPLPAHPRCYCAYFPTAEPADRIINWATVSGETRQAWVRYTAYHLRSTIFWDCPPTLLPLLDDAIQFNKDREEKLMPDDIDPQEIVQLRTHTGRVLLQQQAPKKKKKKQNRPKFDVVIMQPGLVKRADQEDSNWLIPADTIAAAETLFDARPVYLDHPDVISFFGGYQDPKVRNLVAVTSKPHWNAATEEMEGVLTFYDGDLAQFTANLFHQMLEDKADGRPVPPTGLSAVVYHKTTFDMEKGIRVSKEFTYVESVDVVYDAGAGGFIRAALSAIGQNKGQSHFIGGIPPKGVERMSEKTKPTGATTPPVVEPVEPDLQRLSNQIADIEARIVALAPPPAPPAPSAPPAPPVDPSIDARLNTLTQGLEHLTEILAQQETDRTIQGAGQQILRPGPAGIEQVEIALQSLLAGVRPPADVAPLTGIREFYTLLSGDWEMTGLFNEDRVYLANVDSSTMAKITADALNKRVMVAFQSYPMWWEPIVSPEDFSTLQDVKWITLGGIGEMPTVGEGAPYLEMTWDDIQQKDAFIKKGGYVGITLEAIDKDDTRRLQSAPRAIAQAGWLSLSKAVAAIFTAQSGTGPDIYYDDANTRALFHASNNNLGSSAFSWTSWVATRLAMRDQTEHNSDEPLGALTVPRYAVVPGELEMEAIETLASAKQAGTTDNAINPEARGESREERLRRARERVIVVDFFTNANNWAAIADPLLYPSIGLGFRFGRAPEVFSVASPTAGLMFTNDVLPVKGRFFFAVGPIDWRGMYKHNV